MALGHHRGGADEGEVPADPEQHQRGPEMGDRDSEHADDGARRRSATSPARITRSRPNRTITAPVMKLGAYMASTCHWMPSVASVTEWPQPTMATGAEVMTRFIIVKLTTPQATATMKRGILAISLSGRPDCAGLSAHWPRNPHEHQHAGGDQRDRGLRQIGRGEQIGRPQVLGDDDELRSDHAGQDPARQHPRHGLGQECWGSPCRRRRIGRTGGRQHRGRRRSSRRGTAKTSPATRRRTRSGPTGHRTRN